MNTRQMLGVALVLALTVSVHANYVKNFSFEQPGTDKLSNWEEVPFWSSDVIAADSGVESGWPGSTHGDWAGFLMSGDPSVWQLTGAVIEAGEVYTLQVDARDNWSETTPAKLGLFLYYDNAGSRTPVAMAVVDLLGDGQEPWATYTLTFSADDIPASIGNQIGVELINFSATNSWIGIDNVRLVPEPMTLALLGLGGLFLRKRR